MARVTVEDSLEKVPNRFALTVLGSRRARALSEGRARPMVECDNKEGVTALREISSGQVRYGELVEEVIANFIEEQRSQLRSTTGEQTFLEAASFSSGEADEDDGEDPVAEDVKELSANLSMSGEDAADSGEKEGDSDGSSEGLDSEDSPEIDEDMVDDVADDDESDDDKE